MPFIMCFCCIFVTWQLRVAQLRMYICVYVTSIVYILPMVLIQFCRILCQTSFAAQHVIVLAV